MSHSPIEPVTVPESSSNRLGPILLISGTAALLVLAVPAWREAVPWGWFQRAKPLWVLLVLGWIALGIRLLWQDDYAERDKLPGPVGPRFRSVILYSKDHCPLCEEAQALLDQYANYLPPIRVVDISTDEQLKNEHGRWIPVVEIDGQIRFRGRVSELLLRRLIRMAGR